MNCGLFTTPLDVAWAELCERAAKTLTPHEYGKWKCLVVGIYDLEEKLEVGWDALGFVVQGGGGAAGSVLSATLLAKLSADDRQWFEEAMEEATL